MCEDDGKNIGGVAGGHRGKVGTGMVGEGDAADATQSRPYQRI